MKYAGTNFTNFSNFQLRQKRLSQNALRMRIAPAHRTHATPTFVTVDPKRNVLKRPIRVQLDNANVVYMMNVHLQNLVIKEHAPAGMIQVERGHLRIPI